MPGKSPVNHDLETAMHRVGQLEHDYEAAMHRIAELEVLLEKADKYPTVIAAFDNGVLKKVWSNRPIKLITLDEMIESGRPEQIIEIDTIEYYLIVSETNQNAGVDPDFCTQVLRVVEEGV